MADPYYIDVDEISLEEFFATLRKGNIAPARLVLTEEKEVRMAQLRAAGVGSLGALTNRLKSSSKVDAFADAADLNREYVVLLRRQALSWLPKPVPLGKFPGVRDEAVAALADLGIRHGKHLFDRVTADRGWQSLASQADLEPGEVEDLVRLSDLTRIDGVGPAFARFFLAAGAGSVRAVAGADPADLVKRVNTASAGLDYTGPSANLWDMEHCVETAQRLVTPEGIPS